MEANTEPTNNKPPTVAGTSTEVKSDSEKPNNSEKPDFEKLYPGTPLNDNAHRRVEGYVWGCEKIWNDYYLPLKKENEALKQRIKELEGK